MSMTRNEFLQEAAIRAMQGLLVANPGIKMRDADIIAEFAVAHANALTTEFAKTGEFYELKQEAK